MSDGLIVCALLVGCLTVAMTLQMWWADRSRECAAQVAAAAQERERQAAAIRRIYYDWRDARDAESAQLEAAEHRAYMEMRAERWYQAQRRAMREAFGVFDQDDQPANQTVIDGECQYR